MNSFWSGGGGTFGKLIACVYLLQVKASEEDFMAIYAAHLVNLIRKGCNHPEHYNTPLKGFKILVDAGNGAGGFFVDRVLNVLGADTTGSQFLDPDGTFPNHIPNPEDATAMQMASDAVLRNGADLGIVFDTDADRSAVVDSQGNGINRNRYALDPCPSEESAFVSSLSVVSLDTQCTILLVPLAEAKPNFSHVRLCVYAQLGSLLY